MFCCWKNPVRWNSGRNWRTSAGSSDLNQKPWFHRNTSKKNVRSRSETHWSISEFDPAARAKVVVDKWLNAFWPNNLQPERRNRLRRRAIEQLEARYRRKYEKVSNDERETEFHLSPKVMETMRARCGQFNAKLAQQLGRDLEPLGY